MKRQIRRIVLVTLVLGVLLVSCAPQPAPASATAASPSPAQVSPAYPSPVQGQSASPVPAQSEAASPAPAQGKSASPEPTRVVPTYPSPGQEATLVDVYPGPGQGPTQTISWDEAVTLIKGGKVAKVTQAQTLQVTLALKDGTVAETTEPALDEVFKVIDACGDTCKDIERINP